VVLVVPRFSGRRRRFGSGLFVGPILGWSVSGLKIDEALPTGKSVPIDPVASSPD
jgi:hypothetical protein